MTDALSTDFVRPSACPECHGTDPDACVTCITEAGVWLADKDNAPGCTRQVRTLQDTWQTCGGGDPRCPECNRPGATS